VDNIPELVSSTYMNRYRYRSKLSHFKIKWPP
jgi:hypothetical protein